MSSYFVTVTSEDDVHQCEIEKSELCPSKFNAVFFFDELIDSVAGREKNLNLSHAWQDILALHRIKFSFLQLTDHNIYILT